jgi:hypothetical protein
MAKLPIVKRWTDADVVRLRELLDQGATLLRASAALNRNGPSVRKKAYMLGLSIKGVRAVRADLRKSGAIEPGRKPPRP